MMRNIRHKGLTLVSCDFHTVFSGGEPLGAIDVSGLTWFGRRRALRDWVRVNGAELERQGYLEAVE